MSLHVVSQCNRCDFSFSGGYGIQCYFGYPVFVFNCICKSCLNHFYLYSEDLAYINASVLCYLHTESLNLVEYNLYSKLQTRQWKRLVKKANKEQKKQLKIEQARLRKQKAFNIVVERVKLGVSLQVIEQNGLFVETNTTSCPKCNILGTIGLGFAHNEACPKCIEGSIRNLL